MTQTVVAIITVIADLINHSPDPRKKGSCVDTDGENELNAGYTPDKQYFGRGEHGMQEWAPFLEIHERACHTCQSVRRRCHVISGNASRDVKIENVGQMGITDYSIRLTTPPWEAATTQEFVLKYFLAGRYPDVLLLFLPFHHHLETDLDTALELLLHYKGLVDKHIPSDTKVFFLPTHGTFDTTQSDEKIDHLNHVLYNAMEKDMLDPDANRYGVYRSLPDLSVSKRLAGSRLSYGQDLVPDCNVNVLGDLL